MRFPFFRLNRLCTLRFVALALGLTFLQTLANAAERNPMIKIMSFNIRYGTADDRHNSWPERRNFVIETIQNYDPDLFGGQEVLNFQAVFLQELLQEYSFHGIGREDGREKGEFVPIFFRTSRFQLVDAGHFWLSEQPNVPGSVSWDSSMTRMVSWVLLDDLEDDSDIPIYFANTHFDHRGRQARLQSAKLIRRMRDKFDVEYPAILTGDFNFTEDSEAYKVLTNADQNSFVYDHFIDSYRVIYPRRSPHEATLSRFGNHRDGSRIDFVFHSGHFNTINAFIDHTQEAGRNPSDHYPVTATLRLR